MSKSAAAPRRLVGAALCAVLATAAAAGRARAQTEPVALERVRYEVGDDATRVTIVLSRRADYKAFVLAGDPERGSLQRVVLDFPNGRLGPEAVAPIETGGALLQRVRTGQFTPEIARVVLDLGGHSPYQVTRLADPARIVVEVKRDPSAAELAGPPRSWRVVLDPGHGGDDPGAQGVDGTFEKDVTLAIARRLRRRLEEALGAQVFLTRDGDVTRSLARRLAFAKAKEADLFISIHANADDTGRLRGIETWAPRPPGHPAGARLVPASAGPEQPELARRLQTHLLARLQARYVGVRNLGVKTGAFVVLSDAAMPCALVETSFITHPVEGRRLASAAYQAEVAEGLYRGVADFLASRPRPPLRAARLNGT